MEAIEAEVAGEEHDFPQLPTLPLAQKKGQSYI